MQNCLKSGILSGIYTSENAVFVVITSDGHLQIMVPNEVALTSSKDVSTSKKLGYHLKLVVKLDFFKFRKTCPKEFLKFYGF